MAYDHCIGEHIGVFPCLFHGSDRMCVPVLFDVPGHASDIREYMCGADGPAFYVPSANAGKIALMGAAEQVITRLPDIQHVPFREYGEHGGIVCPEFPAPTGEDPPKRIRGSGWCCMCGHARSAVSFRGREGRRGQGVRKTEKRELSSLFA